VSREVQERTEIMNEQAPASRAGTPAVRGQAADPGGLGEALLREGLITEAQLKHALEFQRQTGGDLRDILPKLGYVREHVLVQHIAREKHMHFVDPEAAEVDDELMAKIPREVIEKHQIVPLRSEHGVLLALSDPDDFAAIDEIQFLTSRPIESALAPRASIRKSINQYYQRDEARRKRAAAGQGAAGGAHMQKVLALPTDALLKGLVLALIEKGQVDAESVLAYAALGASSRR
jgi:hypothetical protein